MDIRAAAVVGRRVCRGTDHDTGIDWPADENYQTAVELIDVRCPVTPLNVIAGLVENELCNQVAL